MNELMKDITAPNLKESGYADSLKDVFANIDNNFKIIANNDFVKGENGDSVVIESFDLNAAKKPSDTNYKTAKDYIAKIKSSIKAQYTNTDWDSISADIKYSETENSLKLWDNLDTNPGNLQIIYNVNTSTGTTNKKAVSSLYYIFLDGRYANDKIGKIDAASYQNIIDLSCILVYDYDTTKKTYSFRVLNNAFPTIYYEAGIGLCWKINGNGTGIPVQGIRGRDGLDTKLFIVKGEVNSTSGTNSTFYNAKITEIFDGVDGYITTEDYLKADNELIKDHEYTALILCSDPTDTNNISNGVYFGTIKYELDNSKYTLKGYFDTASTIDTSIQAEAIKNAFKNINLTNTDAGSLPGLFVPIEKVDDNNSQKVHLLTSTSISNNPNSQTELNTDLVLAPVNNINGLKVDDVDKNNIKVEKYLYIKLNESNFAEFFKGYSSANLKKFNAILGKYNNILKYKLVKTVKSLNSEIFSYIRFAMPDSPAGDPATDNIYDNYSHLGGIIALPDDSNDICFSISTSNEDGDAITFVKGEDFLNTAGNGWTHYFKDSMPTSLKDIFDDKTNTFNTSLYYWALDFSYNDFDPNELKNSIAGQNLKTHNGKSYYHVTQKKSTDDNKLVSGEITLNQAEELEFTRRIITWFKALLTYSLSPNQNTEIIWFNSCGFNNVGVNGSNEYKFNGEEEPRVIVHTWQYDNTNIFSIYKYTPIFNNSYSIEDDTILNVNYNINISGDTTKNKTKNLTVNGSVLSNELVVYDTASINEIDKVYTKNTINGTKGITLCGDKFTVVDNDPNYNNGSVITPAVITEHVETDNIELKTINVIDDTDTDDIKNIVLNYENDVFNIDSNNSNAIIESKIPVVSNNIIMSYNDDRTKEILTSGWAFDNTTNSFVNSSDIIFDELSKAAVKSTSTAEYGFGKGVDKGYGYEPVEIIKVTSDDTDSLYGSVSLNTNNLKALSLAEITVDTTNIDTSLSRPLKIKFTKRFTGNVFCQGECSYSDRPMFNYANMKIAAYCVTVTSNNIPQLHCISDEYVYKYDVFNNDRWYGYDGAGVGLGNDTAMRWRHESCYFSLKDIELEYDKIKKYIDKEKKTITIYIAIKSAEIKFIGEDERDVIQAVGMYKPRVQNATPISGGDFQAKKANTGISKNFTATTNNFIKTELKTSTTGNTFDMSSTIVSNDGVVVNYYKTKESDSNTVDKYIFYLGMNTNTSSTGTGELGVLVPCLGIYQNNNSTLEHKSVSISQIIALAQANPSLATYGV